MRSIGLVAATLIVVAAAAGCAPAQAPEPAAPAATLRPAATVTPAVGLTRAELVRALGNESLIVTDTQSVIRPSEAALLADAPRAIYQVVLPADPTKGYVVVYEFPDPERAAAAAAEQQAWLATGPGRVQRPQGTVTIIRQVGSTVVYYDWLPGASHDDSAAGIQTALETVGVGFPVPN
jgi:hypothetical protein